MPRINLYSLLPAAISAGATLLAGGMWAASVRADVDNLAKAVEVEKADRKEASGKNEQKIERLSELLQDVEIELKTLIALLESEKTRQHRR